MVDDLTTMELFDKIKLRHPVLFFGTQRGTLIYRSCW